MEQHTGAVVQVLTSRWSRKSHCYAAEQPPATDSELFISYTYDPSLFEYADPFESAALHRIPVEHYVARVLRYMNGSDDDCLSAAVRILDLYHAATGGCMNRYNTHLLFFTAYMLATKAMSDTVHRIDFYAQVSGSEPRCLKQLEVIMAFECRWSLLPPADVLDTWAKVLWGTKRQSSDEGLCHESTNSTTSQQCTAACWSTNDSITNQLSDADSPSSEDLTELESLPKSAGNDMDTITCTHGLVDTIHVVEAA